MNTFGTVIRINKAHTHSVSLGLSGWRLALEGNWYRYLTNAYLSRSRLWHRWAARAYLWVYVSRDTLLT